MKIKDIGEFALIDNIAGKIKTDKSVIKGIGDDAAVIKLNSAKYLLFKTDMVVEGVHFTKDIPARLIGRKALARNISDIAAMGGVPKDAVICLGLKPEEKVKFVDQIYQGISQLSGEFNINIVGGDTSRASQTFIAVALLGEVEKQCLTLRDTANKGDLIFVSGRLGNSFKSGKHLNFIPRVREARFLVKNYKPTAMIDISDGLILDLSRILKGSRMGAFVYEEFLPLAKKATLNEALYSGEDYELLFTLSVKDAVRLIRDTKKGHKFSFSCIGEITTSKCGFILVDKKHRLKELKPQGFAHF